MPRFNCRLLRRFPAALFFCGLFVLMAVLPASAHDLMPVPAELQTGSGRLAVTAGFRVTVRGTGDTRLHDAVLRALQRAESRTGIAFAHAGDGSPTLAESESAATLVIESTSPGPAIPVLGEDESYSLEVTPRQAVIHAPATVGALHGLETLLQLLQQDEAGWFLPVVTVRDRPRFPWRGLMIDVCRHWQPMEVIKRNLDGMAQVKLNVLHLHLTEDQGFRIESKKFPELQEKGSDGHYFTQEQVREIIAYAAARGIRVVPEFDIPGHATSWVVSHPELASAPGPYAIERHWGVFNPVLDPTNEKVYDLLDGFLDEMAALFPDAYIHIGGDENNGVQWNANLRIQQFIRDHGLKDNAGLHAYFNSRVHAILAKYGKRLIGWDEILHPDLAASSVVHSWRGAEGIAAAAQAGHAVILSHGYYIDLNRATAEHYLNDPLPIDNTLTLEQQKLVLGGEATMWSEWVNPDNIDTRIWPRTAAIAERLWSPRDVRSVDDMYRRLAAVDLQLREAGLQQGNWPRFDLAGVDSHGSTTGALRTLAAVVEPVKDYKRGGLQPEAVQSTPLNELADWSRPDSAASRAFNWAANHWLFAPGDLNPAAGSALTEQLESWRAAGELAAKAPAANTAVAQARVGVARSLAAISRAGVDSIAALTSGHALTPEQRAAIFSALDEAARPTAAAVEFPSLPTLRLLAAAATDPERRAQSSREDWQHELRSLAFPPVPAAPAH
jgi:hexosaminidase